ncbi:hypothetical protein K0B96_15600 [Horticoccus luteus]|uniref:TonB C-terminal domain-containing protein n=1 Tax=Horticoccus luteus TaxID=2862869 RepID=A0A8F9TTE1_9BACT|nr:hypothetical protein [Horticoccus luteus]QYM78706.1 hypothetical protein K0B96_15600 [Horticoccus luteus]
MKKSSLLSAALAGVFVSASAFANPATPAARQDARGPLHVTPAKVVPPTGLPLACADSTVKVEFSLDQAGQPQNIRVQAVHDPIVKRQLVSAFREWRFKGDVRKAHDSGRRFVMPLKLLGEG